MNKLGLSILFWLGLYAWLAIPVLLFAETNCTYTASDFGTANYNGEYEFEDENNGIDGFHNASVGSFFVYWQASNNWLMSTTFGGDEGHAYYCPDASPTTPDECSWLVSGGSSPAGTFEEYCPPVEEEVEIASSTPADLDDIAFGQGIIIFMFSLGLVGMIFNTLNRKK